MSRITSLLVACLSFTSFAIAEEPPLEGATELFNGKNLEGWTQKGGQAKFRAEDGQIIGTSVPNTENSFLCTVREYANFILEIEFKVDNGLNSGVQIRSRAGDTQTTEDWNGKKVNLKPGRVHGLQVEIDPSSRAWTGGIQAEGAIGWLNDLKENEPARKAFRQDEWNKLRIEARGESVKTWLNGVPAADLKNNVIPSGFIALQVHAVGKRTDPLEIRFRNIRLKELQ